MGDFGSRYVKRRPTKELRNDPVPRKEFNRNQENNFIVNIEVDEILLYENQKVSAVKEAIERFESNFYENELYQIDNISLQDTKKT